MDQPNQNRERNQNRSSSQDRDRRHSRERDQSGRNHGNHWGENQERQNWEGDQDRDRSPVQNQNQNAMDQRNRNQDHSRGRERDRGRNRNRSFSQDRDRRHSRDRDQNGRNHGYQHGEGNRGNQDRGRSPGRNQNQNGNRGNQNWQHHQHRDNMEGHQDRGRQPNQNQRNMGRPIHPELARQRERDYRQQQNPVHDRVDRWYSNVDAPFNDDTSLSALIAQVSHAQLLDFRDLILQHQFDNHRYYDLDQYNRSPFIGRNVCPRYWENADFAFYQIEEELPDKSGYHLISCHGNFHGLDNNMGLKHLILDRRSQEVYYECHFVNKLLVGDIIKVFMARQEEDQKVLRVQEFMLMERTILEDRTVVVATVDGKRVILSPMVERFGLEMILEGDYELPQSGDPPTLWKCAIFMPILNPFMVSKQYLISNDEKDSRYTEYVLTGSSWIPKFVVISAEPNEEGMKNIGDWRTICVDGLNREKRSIIELKDEIAITVVRLLRKEKQYLQLNLEHYQYATPQCTPGVGKDCIQFEIPRKFGQTIGLEGTEIEVLNHKLVLKMKVKTVNNQGNRIFVNAERINEPNTNQVTELKQHDRDPIVVLCSHYGGLDLFEVNLRATSMPFEGTKAEETIVQMHGGTPRHVEQFSEEIDANAYGLNLNLEQVLHVRTFLSLFSIAMTFAPFGCGKSYAIIAALIYLFMFAKSSDKKPMCLVMSRTNSAVANLVKIAGNIWVKKLENDDSFPVIVRYVSQRVYDSLAAEDRTDFDLPRLLEKFYTIIINKWQNGDSTNEEGMHYARKYCEKYKKDDLLKIVPRSGNKLYDKTPEAYYLLKAQPGVIFSTIDTGMVAVANTLSIMAENGTTLITNIQIDEASTTPLYEFNFIVRMFPMASIVIVGDRQQLGPYNELKLGQFLDDIAMTSALDVFLQDIVPTVRLFRGYRCDADNTEVASKLFYETSGYPPLVSDADLEYKRSRRARFDCFGDGKSMTFVDGNTKSASQGTSYVNNLELDLVEKIVACLKRGGVPNAEIGIISLYKAQRGKICVNFFDIKSGTVEVFQGSERDFVIVCLTNTDKTTDFARLAKRVNVAITRAKIGLIIVGTKDAVDSADYWKVIVNDYCHLVTPAVFDQQFDDIEANDHHVVPDVRENDAEQADRAVLINPIERFQVEQLVPRVNQRRVPLQIDLNEQGSSASCMPSSSRQYEDLHFRQIKHCRLQPRAMPIDNQQGSSSSCIQAAGLDDAQNGLTDSDERLAAEGDQRAPRINQLGLPLGLNGPIIIIASLIICISILYLIVFGL